MNRFCLILAMAFLGSVPDGFGQDLGFVASPVKMNVLYRGVRNPVSISVPGVAPENVIAIVESGNLTPDHKSGKGNYLVEVGKGFAGEVKVSAIVDGQNRYVGTYQFRIKDIPDPIATIAGVREGIITANRIAAAPTIIPKTGNFDFEVFFKTTSFDIAYQNESNFITRSVTGSSIPAEVLEHIKRAPSGSRVIIDNIVAVLLDGNNQPSLGASPRKLSAISLRIE